jgi:glutamate carboxypeptidase
VTDPRAWVERHREDLLAFLQEIVERESPTEAKAAVDALGQVFQEAYRALGCAVRTVPQVQYGDHVVAETPPVPGPRVLLVGHLDTVYPLGTVARRPFTLRDGRAYGPAVMDMKGGLAVMLFALRALAATRRLGNARVVLNSDEEPGSPTSRDRWAAWSADADWAFVLEPAQPDGSLVLRRKGVGIFRLEVTGRAAHAGAEPERGANAILALAHHALAAAALADPAAGTTVNVGVVRGGTLPYVVPAAAEALIDVRVPTRTEAERVLGGLRALEAAEPVAGTRLQVHGAFHRPPMEPVEGTEALAALVEACGREVGLAVRFTATGGASDGNNLAASGIPTVDGMGPAGAGAHSEEEWADVASLIQKTQLLALVLDRLWAGALPWRSRR